MVGLNLLLVLSLTTSLYQLAMLIFLIVDLFTAVASRFCHSRSRFFHLQMEDRVYCNRWPGLLTASAISA